MRLLIPMAGAGSRFAEAGYAQSKPLIPTTDRHSGRKVPMVVAAVSDLPRSTCAAEAPVDVVFIIRDHHRRDGLDDGVKTYFPNARFVVVDHLTEGQASTCLLAKNLVDDDMPLLIAACDNGMDVDPQQFELVTGAADAVIFTFRDNPVVLLRPDAYGWIEVAEGTDDVTGISIKVPLSALPTRDHAVVGAFWFRRGRDFVQAAETMIDANERINGEFYVDQVFRDMLARGLKIKVLEIDRYICWGTPSDYETYEATLRYWSTFVRNEAL